MLLCKQQMIRQKAGATIESALGANPRQLGKIIAFREMTQDHVSRLAVVFLLKKHRGGFI